MPAFTALLRGVNVGGHHRVAMAPLRALFASWGFASVATYLQSGNVVLSSARTDLPGLASEIGERLGAEYGFAIGVILRDAGSLVSVTRSNPFLERGEDPRWLSVGFLPEEPEPASVEATTAAPELARLASRGEEFVVSGREIYLFHPQGFGSSKINNSFFDRRLTTTTTVRNWRSVVALSEMTAAIRA